MTIKKYPHDDGAIAIMYASKMWGTEDYGFVVKGDRITHFVTHLPRSQFAGLSMAVAVTDGSKTPIDAQLFEPIMIHRLPYNAIRLGNDEKGATFDEIQPFLIPVEPTLVAALRQHLAEAAVGGDKPGQSPRGR
jgi:hypothetical protein